MMDINNYGQINIDLDRVGLCRRHSLTKCETCLTHTSVQIAKSIKPDVDLIKGELTWDEYWLYLLELVRMGRLTIPRRRVEITIEF